MFGWFPHFKEKVCTFFAFDKTIESPNIAAVIAAQKYNAYGSDILHVLPDWTLLPQIL